MGNVGIGAVTAGWMGAILAVSVLIGGGIMVL